MPERSGKEADPPSRVKVPVVAVVMRIWALLPVPYYGLVTGDEPLVVPGGVIVSTTWGTMVGGAIRGGT